MAALHVLAIPYPAQGHVIPLMELSQCLADRGFRVTFVNTEFDHRRVVSTLADDKLSGGRIRLVSIPDGMEPGDDRNNLGRLCQQILQVMPGKLEELIDELNRNDEDDKITCVIADLNMAWALEVAKRMGIPGAAFWPAAAAILICGCSIPKMIDDGIIDEDGTPMKGEMIKLGLNMPKIRPEHLVWTSIGDLTTQQIIVDFMVRNAKIVEDVEYQVCNSSIELEPGALANSPGLLPIGPLLACNRLGSTAGYYWPSEDEECLGWLDHQPPHSVIYIAFGSFTVFDPTQFEELALGLEMTDRPFLWVIRPDNVSSAKAPISSKGKAVSWAPQQKVLEHPSVACFMSHCGWNSTMEGVSNGVPFLCWPYFADQFYNESYICDEWKVGLRLDRDEGGIVRREEIKTKIDMLLGDDGFSEKASEVKEKVIHGVKQGGDSYNNFNNFVDWLKMKSGINYAVLK